MKYLYNYFSELYEKTTSKKWINKLIFIALGISSTAWFLIRVIPKPSRATYPCMQAASPFMSAFVIYLLSLWAGLKSFKKYKRLIHQKRFGLATLCLVAIALCVFIFSSNNIKSVFANTFREKPEFMAPPNTPEGVAKGIFPGRVAWAHIPNTANWEGEGFWFEDKYNNQSNCDKMIEQTICSLTGKNSGKEAWNALFTYFNKEKRGLDSSYKEGEVIAIKINQNNTYSHKDSEELNASPHLTLALLRSLVNEAGIPQKQIIVFDASRYITDALYDKCAKEFPDVKYIDNSGEDGRIRSTYISNAMPYSVNNGKLATGLAACVKDADYLINMALLKGHVGQGVTLCAKNWYGTTSIFSDWRKNDHTNFEQARDGKSRYITFVDFMGHKYLGGKTLVYFIDGLYGSENVAGKPSGKWKMSPFNGNWPNSLFASQDPVAIDAVGLDFLSSEWPDMVDIDYADAYLQEAALADNPPSGTFYDPDRSGKRLSSLGVLEHWNNAVDKQYSRNLGKGEGIELVYLGSAK